MIGVNLQRSTGRWVTYVTYKGIKYKLGTYGDKQTAIAVRTEAEVIKNEESETNPLDITFFHKRIAAMLEKHNPNQKAKSK